MPDPVEFSCDLSLPQTPLHHVWEECVGSGHALVTLRGDWQAQLRQVHQELGIHRVRFHGILNDDMGTLVCEENELLYSFFNANQIMDFLLSIGMAPIVELSFMPETLASGNKTVFHYKGNVTPPKNYEDWGTLIQKLASNWLHRYGQPGMKDWLFEVWNEPNLEAFWTGSQQDYFNLYAYSARALKEVESTLQVGGPVTAQNAWIPEFLDYCQQNNLPADFVSTHYYPTDAFGRPNTDTLTQLEHAPRDVMEQKARQARQQAGDRPLHYTEWNISSNPFGPLHDWPFAAAFAAHILMNVQDLVQGYSYWTFSDIFEENYFPSKPFHGGFGLLTLDGIPKPVYRAFELLHQLGDQSLTVQGSHPTVEVWATVKDYSLKFLLVNWALPRHPIHTEIATLRLANTPEPLAVYVERIDEDHANPRKAWEAMGSPEYLTSYEVDQLKGVSQLLKEPLPCQFAEETLTIQVDLPPQSLAVITLELPAKVPTAGA